MKCLVTLLIVLGLAATDAAAQSFPVEGQWAPLFCGGDRMNDRFGDEPLAPLERDIVGDLDGPAGMHAADNAFLFLRMRLDDDPIPGGAARAFSWAFLINTDTNFQNYEIMIMVDGTGGGPASVVVYRNTVTTTPNDPTDPVDTPAVMSFPIATHARPTIATGTNFGGGTDYWVEMAVPWSVLMPLGFTPTTQIRMWAGTSNAPDRINGDFACHDARTGRASLDLIISDPTVGNPFADSDGDGFTDAQEVAAGSDPNDPNSIPESRLEGGGGCSAGGEAGLVLALLAIRWRRARRVAARDPKR